MFVLLVQYKLTRRILFGFMGVLFCIELMYLHTGFIEHFNSRIFFTHFTFISNFIHIITHLTTDRSVL